MDLPIFLARLRYYAEMPDTGELTIPVTEARLLLDILDAAMALVERNEEAAEVTKRTEEARIPEIEGMEDVDEAYEDLAKAVEELTRVVQVARDHCDVEQEDAA